MDENLLQYIWKFQKFKDSVLRTADNELVKVFEPGNHNFDSGPDFEEARIKIGDIEWAGQVEVHIKSSDWKKHQHQANPAYQNVILHVVWENDEAITIEGTPVPTLELQHNVELDLIENYQALMANHTDIKCGSQLSRVTPFTYSNMVDKVASERMHTKAREVKKWLSESNNDWEGVTSRMILKNFGFSVNKSSFLLLGETLPHHLIVKYSSQPNLLESLFFGQAGFLDDPKDEYQQKRSEEYHYLQKKHALKKKLNRSSWKFAKMRPMNAPAVRIAQVASLFAEKPQLFSALIHTKNPKDIPRLFKLKLNDYWDIHYDFGKESEPKPKTLGKMSIDNVMINTISPLLFAYADYTGDYQYIDQAIKLLETVSSESNRVTKKWKAIGKEAANAFESQGFIQLYQNYCKQQKCLQCNVGFEILKR